MIRIEHLTKRYGRKQVVSDVSIEIRPGESVALWGPNGAGKTTIIRCILGLVHFEGTVEVGGLDVRHHGKAARAMLGWVPQELSFYGEMTVMELLDFSASLRSVGSERVDEVLDAVGLAEHADTPVRELSGGLRQRLGLGTALLADPPILLLDEPTASLDAASRERAMDLLDGLRHDGRTLIVTSHHLGEVGMLADRVVALESSRIVTECPPDELAGRLGLRQWMRVVTDESGSALDVLARNGFAARSNSRGLIVEVPDRSKVRVVSLLAEAGVVVDDLEVWR